MNRYTVILSAIAQANLIEILDHIEHEASPMMANNWLEEFDLLLISMEQMPRRFPVARESDGSRGPTFRRAMLHSHRVLFTIKDATVEIHHIRHGAREDLSEL